MISQAESFVHIGVAAAISAAMVGVGLGVVGPAAYRRARARWPWLIGGGLGAVATSGVALSELQLGNVSSSLFVIGIGVVASLVVAAWLLRVGLRGRYVGDHPHCRRCGFDLFGKPPEGVVCNECGADLAAPRATVVGVRQRRAVPLLAGAFVAVVALAVGASVGRAMMASGGRLRPAQLKPNAWIVAGAFAGPGASADGSLDELMRRLHAGDLSDADIRGALANAERAAADRYSPGNADYFVWKLAVAGWARGAVDEPTMRGYVRRAAGLQLGVPPACAPDRVPYELRPAWPFGFYDAGASSSAWAISTADRVDTIGGRRVPVDAVAQTFDDAWDWQRGLGLRLGNLYRLATPLPAGPTTVEVRMTVTASLVLRGRPTLTEVVPVVAAAPTTIVPGMARRLPDEADDGSSTPGVPDAALATLSASVTPDAGGRRATIALDRSGMDHTFVGDAFAVDAAGAEHPLGPAYVPAGGRFEVDAAALPAGPFTLVIRPRPERGIDFVGERPIYMHELRIDALRVTRRPPPGAAQ